MTFKAAVLSDARPLFKMHGAAAEMERKGRTISWRQLAVPSMLPQCGIPL